FREEGLKRDAIRDRRLNEIDFRVLRFNDRDVLVGTESVLEAIRLAMLQRITGRKNPPPPPPSMLRIQGGEFRFSPLPTQSGRGSQRGILEKASDGLAVLEGQGSGFLEGGVDQGLVVGNTLRFQCIEPLGAGAGLGVLADQR